MEVKDRNRFEEKLKDYQRVNVQDIKAGDHVRYIRKVYNSSDFKCIYAVIDSCEEDQDISMHSYVPENSTEPPYSWILKSKSVPYVRFYKKVNK